MHGIPPKTNLTVHFIKICYAWLSKASNKCELSLIQTSMNTNAQYELFASNVSRLAEQE